MSAGTEQSQRRRTFFGQPFELSTPFGVELWERFSFSGATTRGGTRASRSTTGV